MNLGNHLALTTYSPGPVPDFLRALRENMYCAPGTSRATGAAIPPKAIQMVMKNFKTICIDRYNIIYHATKIQIEI